MQKLDKVKEFEKKTFNLIVELNNLIDDMTAYTASCHQAQIMLKRYNRMTKLRRELDGSLSAACNEMHRTVECVQGDI